MMDDLRERLCALAEPDYQKFSLSLVPGAEMLGVRLPALRKLAREIASGGAIAFLEEQAPAVYFEETMLRGMVIGTMRVPLAERLEWTKKFLPQIDNWSVCDSFCASFRVLEEEKSTVWDFLTPYFAAEAPFSVRFAVVMALDHFLDGDFVDRVLAKLQEVQCENYYVQMAVAWCLSVAVAKYPDQTLPLMRSEFWSEAVLRRAISKCCDSRRVPAETKESLKLLREKL